MYFLFGRLQTWDRKLSTETNHHHSAVAHVGPFNVRSRFGSESECGNKQRDWPKMFNSKVENLTDTRITKNYPRQMYGPRRCHSYALINTPQPHSARHWQPRTFKRTFSRSQMEHKKEEDEAKQSKEPAVVIETTEKKQPTLPIGFCPVEKKKMSKEEKNTTADNKAMSSESKQQWIAMELANKKKSKSSCSFAEKGNCGT